jgi:cold-inducible RNA-binding protein
LRDIIFMNIFVGNLAFKVSEEELKALFAQFGEVKSAKVIKDKFTGESRGFGFIEMASASEAEQAISNLNGMDLEGRKLRVNEANPREERPRSPRPGGSSSRGEGRGGNNRY